MITAQLKATPLRRPDIISSTGRLQRIARNPAGFYRFRPRITRPVIRAVISRGDSKPSAELMENCPSPSLTSGTMNARAVIRIRKKMSDKLINKLEDHWESFICAVGRGIEIQLISEDCHPATETGKTAKAIVRGWSPKLSKDPYIDEYIADFTVPRDFGQPGAILITNCQDREFFLTEIVLLGFSKGPIFFWADTNIHSGKDNPDSRIIFKNEAYLPSQTPDGIKGLRQKDLLSLRGNRRGERKHYERIYDYDIYNDLGDPDKSDDLERPVLGNEDMPYPRRCRTGRPPTEKEHQAEARPVGRDTIYVPRDEKFEEIKQKTFSAGRLKSLFHNLIPMLAARLSSSEISFTKFSQIDDLYKDASRSKEEDKMASNWKWFIWNTMTNIFKLGNNIFYFDMPAILKSDRFAWMRDNEFARQTLAGVNPVNIELLKELPILSKLDPEIYGPPESAITRELIEKELNGISVAEAIENKNLFILDYHDILLPFIDDINSLPNRKAYASRTVFYYSDKGLLTPIIIELSLPSTPASPIKKYVYTHGRDATTHWLWNLAKAHVSSNDAGVHQLVNHWLKTHACIEPYIIATKRQLSSMHPIYKLLNPHMRYTMEINALARQNLINGGGVIENCFSPGKYAMEISSAAYKNLWQFNMETLPADLIRRGMGVEDPSVPGGIKLVIEDYPYAADGLLVWSAIKELVESYVEHYYSKANSISSDDELQAWWDEIKNEGHYDKRNELWWPELKTQDDLSGILTTMIWTASCQHAAVNFGQYSFGGYPPNRPTLMRKLIPQEGDPDYEIFHQTPEYTFLTSLPTQLQATQVMAVQETLSTHSADEEYINQLHHIQRQTSDDPQVQKFYKHFSVKLAEVESIINQRNSDRHLKNRTGAGVPPYELLLPCSDSGVTGRGIPNSISI